MGMIHKLKPEVLSFIIENKRNNPTLSCRYVTSLILERFHIEVSKSSVNTIFKENNLSMPIGRRQKLKKKKFNLPILPVIEGVKAITVSNLFKEAIQGQVVNLPLPAPLIPQIVPGTSCPSESKECSGHGQNGTEPPKINEAVKAELSLSEKRIKEAEEWALKLQEEERIRIERKLNLEKEKHRVMDEASKRALEDTLQAEAENRRKQEEVIKLEEEKAAQESGLKAEKERWARLAEAELKNKQQDDKEGQPSLGNEPEIKSVSPEDSVYSGAILLKALDRLIGGSQVINAAVCKELGNQPEDSLHLVEALIFRSLFGKGNLPALGSLIGAQYSLEKLDSYYLQVQQIENIKSEVAKIIANVFTEAKGVKVNFIDGSIIQLDGQLYSSWPAARFPYNFSNTANNLKNNLNKHFLQGQPLVLFSPAGYDIFPKDFFNLLLNFESEDNYPDSLILFGNQLEELDSISLSDKNRCSLVFGLWPWQFTSSRKVKNIGEFSLKQVEGIDRDLYLAEAQIDLLQSALNQSLTLKGCAIKTDLKEKIRLVVLHTGVQEMSLESIASIYLNHWPNFDEAFKDYSRKIELYSYAKDEQNLLSQDKFKINAENPGLELEDIFANYVKMLDLYLRWYFLPLEYNEKDFSFTSKYFYSLPVQIIPGQNKFKVQMLVGREYQLLKDLEYLNCRLNERQINTADGKIFWFESVFK